jgi:hypothetical protein
MPGGDRTGPRGMGAMSGRGAGYCGGSDTAGYARPGARGHIGPGQSIWGRGGGGPWRWRHWFSATGRYRRGPFGGVGPDARQPDPEIDRQLLETRAAALEEELDSIRKRLEGFKPAPEGE